MLSSDTEIVRAWLTAALDDGASAGKTRAGLAAHCGVSRQAVSGWLSTGRITKHHLTRASQYFGHSPQFVEDERYERPSAAPVPRAAEPAPPVLWPERAWPFKRVTLAQLMALTAKELEGIDQVVETMVNLAESGKTRRRA